LRGPSAGSFFHDSPHSVIWSINKDLICVTTLGLYTKFIEAEREHKCEKTQVSPVLPDTMEGGRGARGRLNMLGISKVRRERHSLKPELAKTMSMRAVSAVILSFAAISAASAQAPRGELCGVGRVRRDNSQPSDHRPLHAASDQISVGSQRCGGGDQLVPSLQGHRAAGLRAVYRQHMIKDY
jgi:hypothetical protein